MKTRDILEFELGSDIPELIDDLESKGIEFTDDAIDILKKTEKSPTRKCRIILLDVDALGFDMMGENREILKRGLSVGHKLCHPEVALHLRSTLSRSVEDIHIHVAMKGVFVGRSELSVLSIVNDGREDIGENIIYRIATEWIANGHSENQRVEEESYSGELWAFELA